MSVLAFAWRAHPAWRLVLAANHDDLHVRPTARLERWRRHPHVLGGSDIGSGGAWLAVSEEGRLAVAMPAHVRATRRADWLPPALLAGDFVTRRGRFADLDEADLALFNPFNLLTVRDGAVSLWTNARSPVHSLPGPGLHGLSNGALDQPWPKTRKLKAGLRRWRSGGGEPRDLLDLLRDERLEPPHRIRIGIGAGRRSPPFSPIFLRDATFGTRCSCVVAVDHHGTGIFLERRYRHDGSWVGETALPFTWDARERETMAAGDDPAIQAGMR